MSLFGDLDVASAADNPFVVKDGTYEATVAEAEVKVNEEKNKKSLVLTYAITTEGEMHGRKVQEYKTIPANGDESEQAARDASFLKMRLSSLGIPEKMMNTLEIDDLVGIECVITVVNKNDFTNVKRLTLPKSGATSQGNPFA